jgi:deoxyribodipyrimidine photo-lyase
VSDFPVALDDITAILDGIDAGRYARRRNFVDGGTRISPFLTRGLVTLPEARDAVLRRHSASTAEKFVFELAWREYWQREWRHRQDAIFSDLAHPQHPVASADLPAAVASARTGITALDAAITTLYDTGWMHNHERMWLAGLVCNIARTHWWEPSRWLYYHLLDGDPASNMLSWQWVAGTVTGKKYLPAQPNINRYAGTAQHGGYLDHDYDALAGAPVPPPLAERTSVALTWTPPAVAPPTVDTTKPTVLYHPFWLNASWRSELDANRLVVLEPRWFDRFPVSAQVTDYLLRCAAQIPGAQVVVADIEDLTLGDEVYVMRHPSVPHWPGLADEMPMLFPDVPDRSYRSFSAFWKQCQKTGRRRR